MAHRKNKFPPFVAIFREMLKCEAWEALSNAARVAYIHLKAKSVNGRGDELTLSFKEMERVMDRHTFSKALSQLQTHGFITKEQRGGLYRKRNYFRLSEQWKFNTKEAREI
jgi:DNA-binding transcriptional ArsR family regulator